MASATVDNVLKMVDPKTSTDDRLRALWLVIQEVAGEEQRDRMDEIISAVAQSPHRSRRHGS